ncbi:MAG: hypothetical protein HYZ16_04445 [Bacteroidetes bacterium]|jgi:hypothetical protein|nr:hypothetical protein [Bacteroidota bacterium]
MRSNVFIYLPLAAALTLQGCTDDCTYDTLQLTASIGGATIYDLNGAICLTENTTETKSPDHVIIPILNESALFHGVDPYKAFELGESHIDHLANISAQSEHLVDIRDRNTLANNFNNPSASSVNYQNNAPVIDIDLEFALDGHPLYLMLALQDVDDLGGAKQWEVEQATWPDGTVITELGDWECILDNVYIFMKGSRFMYDPNKADNTGSLCNQELDYFANPNTVEKVFGTYTVELEGANLFIKTKINTSPNTSYEKDFKVISYSWTQLVLEVENDEGQKAHTVLSPTAYPSEL